MDRILRGTTRTTWKGDGEDDVSMSADEVVALRPVNAWLLVGDESSYPSKKHLSEMRAETVPSWVWAAPPQARPGDLLLWYYTAPAKEIRFAARVASRPFSGQDPVELGVHVDSQDSWITHTPLVEVPPVTFGELSVALGGRISLRGRPRHHLPASVVASLIEVMADKQKALFDEDVSAVVQVPTGEPLTTDPSHIGPRTWGRTAPGALRTTADVEQWVVEPLLRLGLGWGQGAAEGIEIVRDHPVPGAGAVDYAVLRDGTPISLVGVCVGVAQPTSGTWSNRDDYFRLEQAVRMLRLPGALVDANRVLLLSPDAWGPVGDIDRVGASEAEVRTIAEHLVR